MAVDQPVVFDGIQPFCSDMLGVDGDLLYGSCTAGDLLLDYPRPGDEFLKGYGLLGDDQSNEK